MSARKRRNRPVRPRRSTRRSTPPPETTHGEQAAEPEVTQPIGEGQAEVVLPEHEAQPAELTEALDSEPEAGMPEPEPAQPEPETTDAQASEPAGAEPEVAEAAAAEPEEEPAEAQAEAPEAEGPEPDVAEAAAAEPEEEPAEAQTEAAEPQLEPAEPQAEAPEAKPAEPEPEVAAPEPEAAQPEEAAALLHEIREPEAAAAVEPEAERLPGDGGEGLDHGETGAEKAPRSGWAVLAQMGKPRLTRANLFATVLALGLGFAVVAQVQQTQNAGLESLREDELVRILDEFTQDNLRLGNEIRELESTRDRLISGTGTSSEALAAAQERADTLGILAGTRRARGEGIELTIADPSGQIKAPLLLDTLEELRDAGAEAVQIGDVRVVASSYFTDVDGGIELSGRRLERPYTILAIGDSSTLASAMKIPGGVVDTVRGKDGIATITEKTQVDITALHAVHAPQYAQPVPSPTAS
jgi:uncharacterized protein YlxW (UPF0749 family)